MARAKTRTIMPLDRFAELLSFNPLHFNQVILENKVDRNGQGWSCGQTIAQYGWQAHGRVGREEIAIAINRAERDIARELGFDVGPTWHEAELVDVVNGTAQLRGYALAGGREALSLIEADADVSYTARWSGAIYKDVATIVVSVGANVQDESEIALFYPGENGDPAWEIRPINVELDLQQAQATITCRREQLVRPELIEDIANWNEADGEDDDDFLATVDIYRRYNDPATQVRFIGHPSGAINVFGYLRCGCGGSGCVTCGYHVAEGCMTITDRRLGHAMLTYAKWDQDSKTFTQDNQYLYHNYHYHKALVWYRAGYYDGDKLNPYFQMNEELESAVMALALAYLSRPVCECDGIKDLHEYYATDMSEVSSDSGGSLNYTSGYIDNPFGTKRGCVEAWKKVRSLALGRSPNAYAGHARTHSYHHRW